MTRHEVPFGLGCGGVVDLLLEPADTPECRALMAALEGALAGEQVTVLTWLPREGRALARAVLARVETLLSRVKGTERGTLEGGAECYGEVTGGMREGIFVERMRAPQRLFVLGAGDDAKPLVSMAALLGWSVTVVDGRAQLARAERFPEAERVTVLHLFDDLGIRPRTL